MGGAWEHSKTQGEAGVGEGRSLLRAPTPLHGLASLNLESRMFDLGGTHVGSLREVMGGPLLKHQGRPGSGWEGGALV